MIRVVRAWRSSKVIEWACALLIALVLAVIPAAAQSLPPGFYLVAEGPGVALYRKDYRNGSPDFVQRVDLSTGASIDLLHGELSENHGKKAQGMFAGANPAFSQTSISRYWKQYADMQPDPFCVANGQFFYMPESPTPLALPLKVDGELVTEGFGFPQYPEKQLMLALWPDRAEILPLTPENLYGTSAPDVIGGLTEEANKKPKLVVGRTFIGILDGDGDGLTETVLLLTTQSATQKQAARVLRSFGASQVMMLDGGGSTQLICQGQTYIDTTRAIPQAIGVAAAPPGGPPEPASGEALAFPAGEPPSDAALAAAPQTESQPVEPTAAAPTPTAAPPTPTSPPPSPTPLPSPSPLPPSPTPVPPSPTALPSPTAPAPTEASALPTASLVPEATIWPTPSPAAPLTEELPASPPAGAALSPRLAREAVTAAPVPTQAGTPAAMLDLGSSEMPEQVNMADALWLPLVISPVSFIILLFTRKRGRE